MEGETFREVTKVSELRGGRYEALYPGPVWPGKPGTEEEFLEPRREWEWKVREVIARGSTPSVSVTDMMDHIMQDIQRFHPALRAIVQHNGAVVPELDTRKGRRVIKQMPVHPDCKEAMKAREIKWERLEAEATEAAASATDQ